MRIRGWHIEGFGIHRDWQVDEVSPGLSVFYGPNEAGKSTLLAFLRGVLFGYPDGRSNEPKYVPTGGVAHGGRITLQTARGDVVVERYAGRGAKVSVTLADGRAGEASDLAALLHHADARLFRAVFAFGLGELQQLGSLGDAGIQDQLFAAGVSGAGRSAREAVRALQNTSRERFDGVKGRKKDRARVLVRALGELYAELTMRQEAAQCYPELRDREQALAAQLRRLESEAATERVRERRAQRLIELWTEVWSSLAEAREQVAKLAPAAPEKLPHDAAGRLERCLRRIRSDRERLEVVRAERTALAGQQGALRLDEPARAVAVRVAGLQDRLALHRNQRERLAELELQASECDERLASAQGRLCVAPGDLAFDEARLRAVQSTVLRREELRDWKTRIDEARAGLRDEAAAVRLLEGQHAAMREHEDERSVSSRGIAALVALGIGAALAGAAFVVFEHLDRLLVGVVAAAAVAAGAAVVRARALRADALRRARSQIESQRDPIARANERMDRAGIALDALDTEFGVWKSEAGVPSALSAEAAAEFLEEARRGRDALDERDRLASARRRVAAEVESWNAEVDAVLADASGPDPDPSLEEQRVAALAQLRDRCAADQAAREGREPLERRAHDLRERFVACEAALEVSRDGLSALLDEAGIDRAEVDGAEVDGAPELTRRIAVAAELGKLQRRVTELEAELERRLAGRVPGSGARVDATEAEALRAELPHGRVELWEERVAGARARVAQLQVERDEVLREHQDRARDRKRLEESTEVMDLELEKSALEQELREVLDEWRLLRLSARLIETALERFEARHQPGVVREASKLFARVTAGRYPRIVKSEGRAGFAVLTRSGAQRSPSELSQGTTEQLYLCVRLGLVAEMARDGRALPVVMDDVLVNFDDDRAAAMAEVLRGFAADHQIFFFTCSSRTRDLLGALGSDVEVRQIGGGLAD